MSRGTSRQLILRTALDEFAHWGFFGASCDMIAKNAGVSKTLLFKYFGDKENLLRECLLYLLETLFGELREIIMDEGESLADALERCFMRVKAHRHTLAFLIAMKSTPSVDLLLSSAGRMYDGQIEALFEVHRAEIDWRMFDEFSQLTIAAFCLYVLGGDEPRFRESMGALLRQFT